MMTREIMMEGVSPYSDDGSFNESHEDEGDYTESTSVTQPDSMPTNVALHAWYAERGSGKPPVVRLDDPKTTTTTTTTRRGSHAICNVLFRPAAPPGPDVTRLRIHLWIYLSLCINDRYTYTYVRNLVMYLQYKKKEKLQRYVHTGRQTCLANFGRPAI